jgi:hypothetical protein
MTKENIILSYIYNTINKKWVPLCHFLNVNKQTKQYK